MVNSTVTQWLNSGEYLTEIDCVLTNIVRASELSNSEAETASVFEREIFFLLKQKLNLNIDIQRETVIRGIVHSFNSDVSNGRVDSIMNDLIIEYKHHSALISEVDILSAYQQVTDYLIALNNNNGEKRDAILTDGTKISYFSFVGEEVRHTALKVLEKSDIDTVIKAILNKSTKKFEPGNIVKDFAISPISDSYSKKVAIVLLNELLHNVVDKSQMLFSEWKSLMHLSIDDNGKSLDIEKRRIDLSNIFGFTIADPDVEYKALFALQTTYAIIVKLIACKVVDRLNFNSDTSGYHDLVNLTSAKMLKFFLNLEDGYSYSSQGIRNFLEGDFFSWYADKNQWNDEIYNSISSLIKVVDAYSAFSLEVSYNPIDIFKDLYMSIIPQSVRHSMGEYFTPEWLADRVISESLSLISNKRWNAIDPCCGSGIFIISLIKKIVGTTSIRDLSQENRNTLVNDIVSRVKGIDINPLSVLSARVSYFIALHQICNIEDVEIPIYLGDSAIIPTEKKIDDIVCYYYSINNIKCESFDVTLPKRLVLLPSFGKIMSALQSMVKTDNSDALYRIIVKELSDEEKSSSKLLSLIRALSENLTYLHKNNWDGIWIRIVTNFMLIARINNQDLIVGNPPWVKWEHLPAAYTRKIKQFCDVRNIFCNDGGLYGGAQLNICALISNVTASNWLNKDGILAFLMPDSLMSQNSYEEFRNFYLDYNKQERLFLQRLDRWKAPLRPFRVGRKAVSQDFNTYYYGYTPVDYKSGVPVCEITRRRKISDDILNLYSSFDDVKSNLILATSSAKQHSSKSTAFTYSSDEFDYSPIIGTTAYLYRTGVESTPFEVFKMIGIGASSNPNHYRFRNKILKTSRYKVDDIPKDGWNFSIGLIYPMLEGPNIVPFDYDCGNNFHIIPYLEDAPKETVSLEYLIDNHPTLAKYFADHKYLLDMQSEKSKSMHLGDVFFALSKIGPYTFAPYIVAARDNSKFCSTVVRQSLTPWGEMKQTICVKHTIIISQDKNKNFITEDEAHYINGILNSSIVVAYIHSTFKTNGFSLNKSNLFIPKFQPGHPLFEAIVSLSKEATENPSLREYNKELLTTAYLNLCCELNQLVASSTNIDIDNSESNISSLLAPKNPTLNHTYFNTSDTSIAAEPFEIYQWSRIHNSVQSTLPNEYTILIGCYRGKKHLDWILSKQIYNIRLGDRKGSVKDYHECYMVAKKLYLYKINKPTHVLAFNISEFKERTGAELKEMEYPRKSLGKLYMTFTIELEATDERCSYLNIADILNGLSDHTKGAPIFIEPNQKHE